jgi:glyoxylase-like metal-dependent hydrolase (beta-lactamase superfamily II)/rhodanese-related sulfurtransferase
MLLKQYYLGCLAHASYMIADQDTRTAVVVDPQRDVDLYLDDAGELGVEIRFVFLTHFHADFVAGHLELAERAGATICLGARAAADYEFRAFRDGESLTLGSARLTVHETPGHSPESISILVFDLKRDKERPHAVLTGDTLFVGDVGRPDLRASLGWSADQLARMLYRSVHEKLLKLPDDTLVYPAHGAGSLCGKALSKETVSTIGEQRRFNYALQPMSEDEFVSIVNADQPEAPDYFTYDAVLNTRKRETLDRVLERELHPLSLEHLLGFQRVGAQLVDTRDASEFAAAHLDGAINIGLNGQYATWAGILLDRARPILIVAAPGRERESTARLGRIGFDHIVGYLAGGMEAVIWREDLIWKIERITASELAHELGSTDPPPVLDVRTEREWREKHIAGSVNIPLQRLRERIEEAPDDDRLVVHCQGGYRSSTAASLFALKSRPVRDLVAGLGAWEASGLPVVSSAAGAG